MYRFFVEPGAVSGSEIVITGADAHHIKDVLRMKVGENVYISCGDEWEYECEIVSFADEGVRVRIADAQKSGRELKSKITLYQCLPKKDKFEQIIQKCVELGVYKIVPAASSRCVVKLDEKKAVEKVKRWNAIASAAAKQSKRLIEPEVGSAVSFKEAVQLAVEKDIAIIPYEKNEGMAATRQLLQNIQPGQSVGLIIGPEGGFSDEEVDIAVKAGIHPITLGKRILRTETAGPAALAILMYLLEND